MKGLHTCNSLSWRSFGYTGDSNFTEFKPFITRFSNTFCWITVITRCHSCSRLSGCWGGEVSVMKRNLQVNLGERMFFQQEKKRVCGFWCFGIVGGCLTPHSWIEIVPRGHSQNPSETTHYSLKPPLCVPCGAGASLFHTSFIPPMEGFHKGMVWNSYQVSWDTSSCGSSIWGTISPLLGFHTIPFFPDKPTCLLICL